MRNFQHSSKEKQLLVSFFRFLFLVSRLLEIMPPGTVDPSASVFATSMYIMAGLQAVALLSNGSLKQISSHLHDNEPKTY